VANNSSPKRVALWRDRVRRQPASGLTIVQFCAKERCALASFHAWKRRFRLTDPAEQAPASSQPPVFLPVTVRRAQRFLVEPPPVEADLPNGIRLRIPTANVVLACRLIRAVAGAKTYSGDPR
jgi:putative transposase